MLLHESIDCAHASDGRVALDKIRREHFSAILLDLLLPNVNGFELLRALSITDPGVLSRIICDHRRERIDAARLRRTSPGPMRARKPIELIGHMRACVDAPTVIPVQSAIRQPQT